MRRLAGPEGRGIRDFDRCITSVLPRAPLLRSSTRLAGEKLHGGKPQWFSAVVADRNAPIMARDSRFNTSAIGGRHAPPLHAVELGSRRHGILCPPEASHELHFFWTEPVDLESGTRRDRQAPYGEFHRSERLKWRPAIPHSGPMNRNAGAVRTRTNRPSGDYRRLCQKPSGYSIRLAQAGIRLAWLLKYRVEIPNRRDQLNLNHLDLPDLGRGTLKLEAARSDPLEAQLSH